MSAPSISTLPLVDVSKPASIRSSVVLPHPEPPSRQKTSPRWIPRETLSTAATSPNFFVTPSIRTESSDRGPSLA